METKKWTVDVDGTSHDVELTWTYWAGEREVRLDGKVVDKNKRAFRSHSRQSFEIDGHPAVVETKPTRKLSPYFDISLRVDDREVASDSARAPGEGKP